MIKMIIAVFTVYYQSGIPTSVSESESTGSSASMDDN